MDTNQTKTNLPETREGLGNYDRALLVNFSISLGGCLSIPTFRRF